MLIAVVLSDVPAQLIGGRSTISFVLPIIIAGLVIDPVASILLAGLSSLALYIIAWSSGLVFHPLGLTLPFTSLLFFLFSALIWFTMTRLEQALLHLQELNRDLEQRIAARTRELTAANQQLRFMNERLLLHDRSRSAFVMMVSHDLRAPLGAILSNTEMLGLNVYGVLAERQQGVIYRIAHNARSLLRLVDDLLDQSKIEAGQILVLHPVRFAPGELLAETLSALGDLAQAKGLVLTTTLSADLPPYLVGDPQRLLQILLNLTANAIKFTDVGTVRVEIGRQGAEQWWLRVRDTGRGISPEEQAHIFEPFQRGAAADALPGAGLGLSIVNHLVGLMNGEIRLVSAVQQGSEFTIVLPLISSA
jgi:signal transduction histidine kinase